MVKANRIDARIVEKASRGDRDELPMDGQQSNQRRRKDSQVGPIKMAAEAAVPRI